MKTIVSIITPLYNREELVKETYAAIAGQSMQEWEWLVVDDGSTDNGPDYIQKLASNDSRIQYLTRVDGQKGPSRCRNIGAKAANGTYLLFLDSDDLIAVTCLQNRVTHLEQFPDLDFAVFTQATFENALEKTKVFGVYFENKEDYLNSFIKDTPPWCISGPLWKKESYLSTGGFREDYSIMEDPELHIRAIIQGLTFEVIKGEPDFFYRLVPKTPQQEIRFWEASIKGRIVFYKELLPIIKKNPNSIELIKQAKKGWLQFLKTFLLSRSDMYSDALIENLKWAEETAMINSSNYLLVSLFHKLMVSPKLRRIPFLKGLIFRCIY